jgi:hypothetical protein
MVVMLIVRILIAYIVVTQGRITEDLASRFVGSYLACDPGVPHQTLAVCNGGPISRELSLIFEPMSASYLPRLNDDGWDITGFMDAAAKVPCDMLVCLGESVYFHSPVWLRKMAEAWERYGPGMYGFWSSHLVRPHMNTTGFVCSPSHLLEYPRPRNRSERYNFEHGINSFWRHLQATGRPTKLVTWDGVWDPFQWRLPQNILWRGNQTNCLAYCSHTDRFRAADSTTKIKWSRFIDAPFK